VDLWDANLPQGDNQFLRVTSKKNDKDEEVVDQALDAAWLFGSNNDKVAFSGAIQFGEAHLLAFPIRSAKGSFAWITSPLLLRRAKHAGVLPADLLSELVEPPDGEAIFDTGKDFKIALGSKVVLEEYTFEGVEWTGLDKLAGHLAGLLAGDAIWLEAASRLVILSDGMMSYFAQNACEVAQHVRISDETGTAEGGALFNQENVPSETLFYSLIQATDSHLKSGEYAGKKADDAWGAFAAKLKETSVFQFGGDASTGLGYCTLKLS
jgi:CRISPR-associated protein Cmr4